MSDNRENNKVTISGEVVSNFEFDHEVYGEGFYVAKLSASRSSSVADIIPIMVSERLVDVKEDWIGRFARVEGNFRSYNKHEGDRNHLMLSVFARELEALEEMPFMECQNKVYLDSFICKEPIYRKTPFGREISDVLLAVNRAYGKSDYIPCICWGRNARFVSSLGVGTHIVVEGRIQSREYHKKINDTEIETRTAYEVSVSKIEVIEEMED